MEIPERLTLYERIGGKKILTLAIRIFYQKVRDDEQVNYFFRWVDMEKLSCKFTEYLAHAMGAPVAYAGRTLKEAHSGLAAVGMNNEHFNRMKEHLTASFVDCGVQAEAIKELDHLIEKARRMIFGGSLN